MEKKEAVLGEGGCNRPFHFKAGTTTPTLIGRGQNLPAAELLKEAADESNADWLGPKPGVFLC